MSVTRPGVQKLNMLVSSPKAAIAANLGLANRYTGISDGIFAQRTLTGCGIHLNNRLFNSASISATRHALNDNRTALFNNIGVAPHRCNNNNGNNTMNKFMAGMMAMNMMAQLTAKTVQTINEAKAAKAENNGTVKKGTGTDGAGDANNNASAVKPKSLTAMTEAKDSSTLRGAIEAAESDKANMQSRLTELQAKLPELKQASEQAKAKLAELEPKINAKETEVKQKETEVENGKKLLDNAETRLRGAETQFDNACTNLTNAETTLRRAESTLASTKQYITDASGNRTENPAYRQALAARDNAQRDVEAKQRAKEQCAKNLAEAQKGQNTAATRYDELQTSYNKAKGELAELQNELTELKRQETEANGKVAEYEQAVKQEQQLTADIAALTAEIPTQRTRLTELEQQENNGLASANSTILDLQGKMAGTDGKIGTNDDKNLKGRDKENYDAAIELRRNVNYTKLYATAGQTIGGKTFRTGKYDGETLYMIGAKKVDEKTYTQELNRANGIGQPITMVNAFGQENTFGLGFNLDGSPKF